MSALTSARRRTSMRLSGLEIPDALRCSTVAAEAKLLCLTPRERTAAMRRTLRRLGVHLRAMGER